MRTLLLSALALVFCYTFGFSQIAHWPLDGNTQEIIGNKHGIPSTSGVGWVNDDPVRGKVMKLDGVSGFVTLPQVIWENPADTNTTITCWFNYAGGGNWQRVYSLGLADPAWSLMYFCPRDGWDGNGLHITLHPSSPDIWYDYVGEWGNMDFDTITYDKWYFSAVVFQEDSFKVYLNDKLIVADDSVFVTPQKIQPVDAENVLGKSHWADPTFNGMIDDFRIYGEALTTEQIMALFEEGNVGIPDAKTGFNISFYGLDGRIMYNNTDDSQISRVSVYSITGNLLFSSERLSDLPSQQFRPGIYLVTAEKGSQQLTQKIALFK